MHNSKENQIFLENCHNFLAGFFSSETKLEIGTDFNPLALDNFQLDKNDHIREQLDLIIANKLFLNFSLYFKYLQENIIYKDLFNHLTSYRLCKLVREDYQGIKFNLENYLNSLEEKININFQDFKKLQNKLNSFLFNEEQYYIYITDLLKQNNKTNFEPEQKNHISENKTGKEDNQEQEFSLQNKKENTQTPPPENKKSTPTKAENIAQYNEEFSSIESQSFQESDIFDFCYKIYSQEYDEIILAKKLLKQGEKTYLWQKLKEFLKQNQTISTNHKLLFEKSFGQQKQKLKTSAYGKLNFKYLAEIITKQKFDRAFKSKYKEQENNLSVTILFDNSGSMHGLPIKYITDFIYSLAQIFTKLNIAYEILGYTTRSWRGGRTKARWDRDGKPKNPGRLNDLRHIIYKDHLSDFSQSKKDLSLVLKSGFLKENIDGEALEWSLRRAKKFMRKKHFILYFADGMPIDDATNSQNHKNFLTDHLISVLSKIKHDKNIKLIAIGPENMNINLFNHYICLSDYKNLKLDLTHKLYEMMNERFF